MKQKQPKIKLLGPQKHLSKRHLSLWRSVQKRRSTHKRVLMHPLSVFGLLLLGVLLIGITMRSFAADPAYTDSDYIDVSARIEAPSLAVGAVITNLTEGQVFTSKPITVEGTCPEESYVRLYRNGLFSGTAACIDKTFAIETDLFDGTNAFQAQAYNRTDIPGPSSQTVKVIYIPPVPAGVTPPFTVTNPPYYVPPTGGKSSPQPQIGIIKDPLLLLTDYSFKVVTIGMPYEANLRFQFGSGPYSVRVDWGDGSSETIKISSTTTFSIRHIYETAGVRPVRLAAQDSSGSTSVLQLLALVKKPGSPGTIASIMNDSSTGISTFSWLWLAWPTYGLVCLMVVSFWLGERREFLLLTKQSLTKQKLRPR